MKAQKGKVMDIDNYDWEDLYQKAEEYIHKYIPEVTVNKGCRKYLREGPRVEVYFPYKGNKSAMAALRSDSRFRKLCGYNANGNRMVKGEVIFSADGRLNRN